MNVGSYEAALQTLFDSRVNINKEMMELIVSERILELKIRKKELTLNRLSQLVDEADHCRVNTLIPFTYHSSSLTDHCRVNTLIPFTYHSNSLTDHCRVNTLIPLRGIT